MSSRASSHRGHINTHTDLTTIGDLDAFEPLAGMFTSHDNIALYGEEAEDVANLSAIDGSKYE